MMLFCYLKLIPIYYRFQDNTKKQSSVKKIKKILFIYKDNISYVVLGIVLLIISVYGFHLSIKVFKIIIRNKML